MKKISALLILFFVCLTSFCSFAQTNVSGGIYSNTTWTLANSPYIVVDTVVVFPGVTLTIQPGVTVKFDSTKYLEIRQGTLIANGTAIDSITFTSNSLNPTRGSWNQILLNTSTTLSFFNFCHIEYANRGISDANNIVGIKNSTFINNVDGMFYIYDTPIDSCRLVYNTNGIYNASARYINFCNISHNSIGISGLRCTMTNCTIDSNQTGLVIDGGRTVTDCSIEYNQMGINSSFDVTIKNCIVNHNSNYGVYLGGGDVTDTLMNCELKFNGIGLIAATCGTWSSSDPGIITQCVIESNSTGIQIETCCNIYCNSFCNNTSYDLENMSSSPYSVPNNYWCTADSDTISMHIYDGYDDVSRGLVTFGPVDMNQCYLTGCALGVTATVTNATCGTCQNGSAIAHVANGFPPYSYSWYTTPIQITATATGLASGTYTVCVTDGHGCTACNYSVYVDSTNCTGFAVHASATNASCSLCSDGTAIASITAGTPPFAYTWLTSPIQTTQTATGLAAGTYSVCVTDLYGCTSCDTAIVSVGSCSAYYTIAATGNPHEYDLTNLASGTAPLTYDWNWGDGSPHDTAAYPSHTYASSGTYTICLSITDSAGCTANYCHAFYLLSPMSNAVYVNVIPPVTTGISTSREKSFSVFPNPATSSIKIVSKSEAIQKIMLYSMDGKLLRSIVNCQLPTFTLNINDLTSGVYYLDCFSNNAGEKIKVVKY